MSFRLRHDWIEGAALPLGSAAAAGRVESAAFLSSCSHCGVLRVRDALAGIDVFLSRASSDDDRIRAASPPCVSSSPHFRAPW